MKETPRAAQAWADYLALGPERSLEKLAALYRNNTKPTPVRVLKEWSTRHGWQQRLTEIAEREAKETEEREAVARRTILEAGYGLKHERVKALADLATRLYAELTAEEGFWLKDRKGIGAGENWREVEVERFNADVVEQFRGLLDDIAKEKGERKQAVEHSGEMLVRRYIGVNLEDV